MGLKQCKDLLDVPSSYMYNLKRLFEIRIRKHEEIPLEEALLYRKREGGCRSWVKKRAIPGTHVQPAGESSPPGRENAPNAANGEPWRKKKFSRFLKRGLWGLPGKFGGLPPYRWGRFPRSPGSLPKWGNSIGFSEGDGFPEEPLFWRGIPA
jgi:hypothetical protein